MVNFADPDFLSSREDYAGYPTSKSGPEMLFRNRQAIAFPCSLGISAAPRVIGRMG